MLPLQIAVGFGIAVIFPLLVYYGVSTFRPPPKNPQRKYPPNTPASEEVEADRRRYEVESKKYDVDLKSFSRVLILTATTSGVAAIFIGAFLNIHAIGTGLVFGGITAVAHGYWTYWSYLEDWIRFVSLLAGFAMLLFVGVHLFAGS